MKKIIQLVGLLALVSLATGCASTGGYFVDRGRDAADIFTSTIDIGAGASARCGPIHVGLYAGQAKAGLKGGTLLKGQGNATKTDPFIIGFPWIEWRDGWCFYYDDFHVSYPNTYPAGLRGKVHEVDARLPLIAYPRKSHHPEATYPWIYFFDIEASFAVGGGITLGFNPIELVDFVAGWLNLDFLHDDIGHVPTRSGVEAAEHELLLAHRKHPRGDGSYLLGNHYFTLRRFDDARTYFELYREVRKQLSKGRRYWETILYLSLISLEQGNYEQARSIHQEFLSIGPDIDADPRQFWMLKSLTQVSYWAA